MGVSKEEAGCPIQLEEPIEDKLIIGVPQGNQKSLCWPSHGQPAQKGIKEQGLVPTNAHFTVCKIGRYKQHPQVPTITLTLLVLSLIQTAQKAKSLRIIDPPGLIIIAILWYWLLNPRVNIKKANWLQKVALVSWVERADHLKHNQNHFREP